MADLTPPITTAYQGGLLDGSAGAPGAAQQDVSVAGVLLLTSLAVALAILSIIMLGVTVMGAWWLVMHIPVPMAIKHLIALLGL